jgi:hypothetical protein
MPIFRVSEYDTEYFTGHSPAVTGTDSVDGDVEMLDRPEQPFTTNFNPCPSEQSRGSNPESKEVCFGTVRRIPEIRQQ